MKFTFVSEITISIHTDVEATSLDEALKEAAERGMQSFCHQCADGDGSKDWATSGELDGDPAKITSVMVDDCEMSPAQLRQVNRAWKGLR